MTFKTITRRGRDWLWPEYDVKLLEAFDDVDNIDTILKYCPNRRVAIQAGGGCGVWPWRLSKEFETVYTFEPDQLNFRCLERNAPRTFHFQAALYDSVKLAQILRHTSEMENAGASYISGFDGFGSTVVTLTLDDVIAGGVDLICLDVEGSEAKALLGAEGIIQYSRPTIVIEEKPLPQGGDHLCARRLLESWGYAERAKVGNDVVFTHG